MLASRDLRKYDTTDANTAATFKDKIKMKDNLPGPSSYNLPDLIGQGSAKISTLRSTPAPTFGMNPEKKSFYHDCYKDFIGS